MKEAKIRAELKKKNTDALQSAIDVYGAYVKTVLLNVLGRQGGREDVEELMNDVFYTLWRHVDDIYPGKMKQWLAAVARNRAKSFLRSHQVQLPMDEDFLCLPDETPEDAALAQERKEQLLDAIHHMPKAEKEVFLRYYFNLQSVEEISLRMNIPTGTVKSRLYRGRKRLRLLLKEQEDGICS